MYLNIKIIYKYQTIGTKKLRTFIFISLNEKKKQFEI